MKTLLKKIFYKQRAREVAEFYNNWSDKFMTVTDTFQGFRTEKIEDMHEYTIRSAGLADNDIILDAGCGVGGPAIYFAQHLKAKIYALTNSKEQVRIINTRKEKLGIRNLEVVLGDYHRLPGIFGKEFFTKVLFLESIGHSYYPQKVANSAYEVLKNGGALYVREPFKLTGDSPEVAKEIARIAQMADKAFIYNHQQVDVLLSCLRNADFGIEFSRHPEIEYCNIDNVIEHQVGFIIPKGAVAFVETREIKAVKSA